MDESNVADQFEPVVSQYTEAQVKLLPDLTHMGVVIRSEIRPVIKEWMDEFGNT